MEASKSRMNAEFKVETKKQVHVMPEMHYHDFYEIYIQNEGVRDHIVSSAFYELQPGDVMLFKPNLLHQSISKMEHTRTIVYFTESFLKQYFSAEMVGKFVGLFSHVFLSLSKEEYNRVAKLVKRLRDEECTDSNNLVFVHLAELLMVLLGSVRRQEPETAPLTPQASQDGAVSPLIAYVHENFLVLNSIEQIADTFYITPSHLCRTFKKLTGYTVVQYINALKIHKACGLLKETERTVTEIALECGFNSTMYFCKIFKNIIHLTPLEYRRL